MKARTVVAAGIFAMLVVLPPTVAAGTTVTLTVTKHGNGRGFVRSDLEPGIACGQTCTFHFPAGTTVVLTATPSSGSVFLGWGGDCSGSIECEITLDAPRTIRATFALAYRPDGWIKLCGLSDGCTIHGLPNPWKGKNVYNATGRRQMIRVLMQDGEGVRFWFTFENDGIAADTIRLEGCQGNRRFHINKVQVGFYKRPTAGSVKITEEFKRGTATFEVGPAPNGERATITLNIIAPTTAEGVSYRCPVRIWSQGNPDLQDTMVAKMTTY